MDGMTKSGHGHRDRDHHGQANKHSIDGILSGHALPGPGGNCGPRSKESTDGGDLSKFNSP